MDSHYPGMASLEMAISNVVEVTVGAMRKPISEKENSGGGCYIIVGRQVTEIDTQFRSETGLYIKTGFRHYHLYLYKGKCYG
jgi:hypothetical protein